MANKLLACAAGVCAGMGMFPCPMSTKEAVDCLASATGQTAWAKGGKGARRHRSRLTKIRHMTNPTQSRTARERVINKSKESVIEHLLIGEELECL